MSLNLDSIDRKIVHLYLGDARLPISRAAKQLRLSREIVQYRLSQMEKIGLIQGYVARIDQSRLGSVALILLRIHSRFIKQVRSFVVGHGYVNWACSMTGQFDLACTVFYDHPSQIAQFIMEMETAVPDSIIAHEYFFYTHELKFDRRGLFAQSATQHTRPDAPVVFQGEIVSIRPHDVDLLLILASDCSRPILQIARDLDIVPGTVRRSMSQLRKSLIRGYTLALNTNALGLHSYNIYLGLKSTNESIVALISGIAWSVPEIVYCSMMMGRWQVVCNVQAASNEEFSKVLASIKLKLDNLITDVDVEILNDNLKEVFLPKGKLEEMKRTISSSL